MYLNESETIYKTGSSSELLYALIVGYWILEEF